MTDYQRLEQERQLAEALIGPRHEELYLNSPTFKAGIDSLALLLVPMVDGLAADARGRDAVRATHSYATQPDGTIEELWAQPTPESE